MEPRADPAWDSFWRYDRLSSFHAAPNYGPPVADGWTVFFNELPDGAQVLDVATGNGAIAVLAVAAGKNFAVTGADLASVEPSAFVSQNQAELAQVHFLANTAAEALPLADCSMDAIVSQFGIEYSDLTRSLPEASRVLAGNGRLRFACHAAEGAIAQKTVTSIADANFLIDLDLVSASSHHTIRFNEVMRNVADRAKLATDVAMLANVHQTLCDAFDYRRSELTITAIHLVSEIRAHRDRQASLKRAARTREQMADIGAMLAELGLTEIRHGEQRDGVDLLAHVIEARRP